jgi:hypothetical protein
MLSYPKILFLDVDGVINTRKHEEAERQIKSDELVTEAAKMLSLGRYAQALPILNIAEQLYVSERSRLHRYWAKLKIDSMVTEDLLKTADRDIKSMAAGTRKTPLWIFVSGLIKRIVKDYAGAQEQFQKVLQEDPGFMDARRELTFVKAKTTKVDILNGDLSAVIKDVFKKNKGA